MTRFFWGSIINLAGGRSGSRICLMQAMISIFPPNYLTVLITNPKTPPGVYPADGPLGAGDPAAPAFQAPLVGKGHVIFPEDIAFCRAGIETGFPVAAPAFLFLQGDMDLPVDIKFIEGQFF